MADIKAWVDEHRAIHAAATPEAWTTIQRDGEGPAVVAVPDADGYSPWQAYVGMCSGYDDENATAIVDAHNITVPTALSMIEAVLELHGPVETGVGDQYWKEPDYCPTCSEYWPCETWKALEGVIDSE